MRHRSVIVCLQRYIGMDNTGTVAGFSGEEDVLLC